MLEAGAELLDEVLEAVDFSELSELNKREWVIEKCHYGRELTPEERDFGIAAGLINE